MIHPGFISREPNVEIFLKRMRSQVEKDYKKFSTLWFIPLSVLLFLFLNLITKAPENINLIFRLSILFIAGIYVVIALPLISKVKLLPNDSAGAIKANLANMKAYYQKAFDNKWRYIGLTILSLLLSIVTVISVDPGIEQFRISTTDTIFELIFSSLQYTVYVLVVLGSFITRKRYSALILDLEKKYKEMGINL